MPANQKYLLSRAPWEGFALESGLGGISETSSAWPDPLGLQCKQLN